MTIVLYSFVLPYQPMLVLPSGVHMNVNATQKLYLVPVRECYQCGDLNYVVYDCPMRLNV